jgi:hypothetical protein
MTTKKPAIQVGKMIRISISYFYTMGSTLKPLSSLSAGPLNVWWATLYAARASLEDFFGTDFFSPAIQNSYASGQRLLTALVSLTNQEFATYQITMPDAYSVTNALQEFETVLRNELNNADAYYVTRKAGYDTTILVANAEKIFPSDLPIKAGSAISDVREAGKCLGYEASTAAGFHIMRALESVVRQYWTAVANGTTPPRNKTLGGYLKELNDNNLGEAKVRAVLQQIKDLHRNPLAHPGDTLSLDEAIGLFGIVHSAIAAMLGAIPVPPPPPNPLATALAAIPPTTP